MVKVYRIYMREGPNYEGKFWGREFGIDYLTLEVAREVKGEWATAFPHCRYFIRAANPRKGAAFPYSVGHVIDKGQPVMRYATVEEAEARIEALQRQDPEGVARGDYYIDGPEGDPSSEPGHPDNPRSNYDADQTEARDF